MSSGRKRLVTSCVPCYTRKQKCNRKYPCNHCSRRRLPEECAYYSAAAPQNSNNLSPSPEQQQIREELCGSDRERTPSFPRKDCNELVQVNPFSSASSDNSQLAEVFGYFQDSDNNTLALVRKLSLDANDSPSTLPPEAADEVNRNIEQMPDRQILDFLIRHFIADVNWIDHLIFPPWFLAKYQSWWAAGRTTLIVDVDFAVLILRICSYASHFLPSPSCTVDKIRGQSLSDIRNTCDEIAETLASISSTHDNRGSLIRVQHLAFFSLRCQMDGRKNDFWDALSRAIRVAHTVGIHNEAVNARAGVDEIEKEIARRTFCNLHIWDSLLCRQLDRTTFLPRCLNSGNWPRMHLGQPAIDVDGDDFESAGDAPDPFTERLLQARLADFWRCVSPTARTGYDMMVAEEHYERFRHEYLAQLPPAFALQPNKVWDKHLTKLPMQRQLLHIAIFDSLCWNMRPLLLQLPPENNLLAYKRMLLESQKKALAVAALRALMNVSQLHAMLGGCHTRFAGLIFSTFEPAVLLVYLCMDPLFPSNDTQTNTSNIDSGKDPDPLREGMHKITRNRCIEAVQSALDRLKMLAEVSNMAEIGASTLTQLFGKISTTAGAAAEDALVSQSQQVARDVPSCFSFGLPDSNSQNDFLSKSHIPKVAGDLLNWDSFDLPQLNAQGDSISMNMAQELHGCWGSAMTNYNY